MGKAGAAGAETEVMAEEAASDAAGTDVTEGAEAEGTPVGADALGRLGWFGFGIENSGEELPESLIEPTTRSGVSNMSCVADRDEGLTDDDVVVCRQDAGDREGHRAGVNGEVRGKGVP